MTPIEWELEADPLEAARQCLDHLSAQWDAARGRLNRFVEREAPGPWRR